MTARLSLLLGLLVSCSATLRSGAPSADAPPNVVMIISDDQAWTDYGFMGHPQIKTPRLDRLAKESLAFRRGYVPTSLCSPSLVTLATGLYPYQHMITGNEPPRPKKGPRNGPEYQAAVAEMITYIDKVPTLPKLLAKKGYLSMQTGKWWMGHYSRGGFTHGMTHGDPKRGGRHGDVGLKISREGMQPIKDFIEGPAQNGKKPFFLWHAPFLPHSPHNPPDRFLARYRDKTKSLQIAKYWAMVEWFDETCGDVLDYLDEKGLRDNTIVVYVCDNGWIQKPDSGGYAPRSKRSPYDGGLRTPILVRWPGHVKPRMSDVPVSTVDIVPTILRACGLEPTAAMQGVDLLDDDAVRSRQAIFGDVFLHNAVDIHDAAANLTHRWVISGGRKLIVSKDGATELFDIDADPFEKKPLDDAAGVAKLRALLDAWWAGK